MLKKFFNKVLNTKLFPNKKRLKQPIAGNKKFEVIKTTRVESAGIIKEGGDFRVQSKTRPKRCPECLTRDKITKLSSGKWCCKKCGKTW